jgi:hypothetical protein
MSTCVETLSGADGYALVTDADASMHERSDVRFSRIEYHGSFNVERRKVKDVPSHILPKRQERRD